MIELMGMVTVLRGVYGNHEGGIVNYTSPLHSLYVMLR